MNPRTHARYPIDWTCLFAQDELASRGLQQLLAGEAIQLRFEPGPAVRDDLWALYWSYRMGIRQRGQHTLYFYYPTFYSESLGNVPLVRWTGRLIAPTGAETEWEIQVDSDKAGELHTQWLNWAESNFPYNWADILREVTLPKERASALRALASAMSREAKWTLSNPAPGLIKEASLMSFAEDMKRGGLAWLATVGVDNSVWYEDTSAEWATWPTPPLKSFNYSYLLPLTPASLAAWQKLGEAGRVAIAQRGSLAGTIQLLDQLVLPHLVGGEPVLIVSRDQSTLDRVAEQLSARGWQDLLSRWQDERLDWPILQSKIQAYLKVSARSAAPTDQSWQVAFGRYRREEQQLQDFLSSTRRTVLGTESWQDVLGLYLRASRREGKARLATHLQASLYHFTPTEYADIQRAIKQTEPLYRALDNLYHPLADLNAAIFIHQDEEEAAAFIRETAARLLHLAQPLHQRYIRRQSEYADQLMAQLEGLYLELRRRWSTLNALLSDLTRHYGTDVLTVRQGTLRLKAAFSKRWQAATRERQGLIKAYDALRAYHLETAPFAVDWLPETWTERPLALPTFLEDYERKLTDWQLAIPAMAQEELLRLNYKTADPDLAVSAQIQPLENALEECIDEINALGLYQLPLQSKHLTLLRQQRYLEEIIERLERTQASIEPFAAFYAWQRNWFSLSEIARKSLQAILRTRPADWSAAFASWYFNECLSQTHTPALSFRLTAGKDAVYGRKQLWQQTQQQVLADWQTRRTVAAKTLQVAARQAALELAALPEGLGRALSRFTPITLATPEIATRLRDYYRQLIVVEAQRIPKAELAAMTQSEEQGLVALYDADLVADDLSWSSAWDHAAWARLDFHAAEQSTDLDYTLPPTSLRLTSGLYQRAADRNREEALAVLDWLNTLSTGREQRVARVGIVCFTEGQRNEMLQLLYQVKKTHQAAAEHLQRLERNGLQLVSLPDLADHDFTHLLVSLTYGPEHANGAISPELAALSKTEQQGVLRALLKCWARAQEAHWFCSWPKRYWTEENTDSGSVATGLLPQLLRLAAAKDGAASRKLAAYLPSLQELRTDQRGEFAPLARELIFRIGDHFPHWQWAYERSLGPAHPLLEARTLEGQRILFLPDGLVSQAVHSSVQWESTQRERLQAAGFILVDVPLASLWKSPSMAFHQLVHQLGTLISSTEEE